MSPMVKSSRHISALWVRRPITGVMIFAAVALVGFFSFSRLQLALLPDIEFPIVAVITSYQGAGPEAVEQLVSRPIEQALASVENVEEISSTSQQGTSLVMVSFGWGGDMDAAEQEVRKNLELFAEELLPDDAAAPMVFAFDPSMQPVIMFNLNAPGTPASVRSLAEDEIEPYLSRVPGVASVEVSGGMKREIQVRLMPEWLEAYGVDPGQVVASLRGANVLFPGGRIDQGGLDMNVATDAQFSSVAQIGEVVVGQRNGQPVRVMDVAEVVDGFEESNHGIRSNGQSSVTLQLRKQSDANTVRVVSGVMAAVNEIQPRLPEGTQLSPFFDQGKRVTRSISNLATTAVAALMMTGLILLLFLRSWRASAVVLVGIPLAVLAAFTAMEALGVTLNIISMAGLALAIGLLVDNAIVVMEAIFLKHEQGLTPAEAAVAGTREMSMPIIAATLTTVSVFAPVLFVEGIAGQMFRDMSLTIVISLSASLIVALTLVPLLASLMLGRRAPSAFERGLQRLTSWLDPLTVRYGRLLRQALHRPRSVLAGAALFFVATMGAVSLLGTDFMPSNDFGELELSFEVAPGTSLDVTAGIVDEIEGIVRDTVPEAVSVSTEYGEAEGIGAMFGGGSNAGSVRVVVPPRSQRDRTQDEIQAALRTRFDDLSGVVVHASSHASAMLGGSDVEVKIFGEELEPLRRYGFQLKQRLQQVEGAADVSFSMEAGWPEIRLDLDREQIRALGLSPAQVAQTVSTYFMGTTATVLREGGEEHNIKVQAPRAVREDVAALRALPIVTPSGQVVPLETVAEFRTALGPTAIDRTNQRRLGTIALSSDGVALGDLISGIEAAIAESEAPVGITTSIEGSAEDMAESFASLAWAFAIAFLLVYMVMASQFESLLEPFVILGAIPFALSGVVLALLVTGTTLQVTTLIGVIMLVGIVVNNGIVLIDVLKKLREQGKELVEAAVEAGRLRLRPILMTTGTTVLSMVPLALELGDGAETWSPMARAVIGGLTVSTLLTLFIVPTAYVLLAGMLDRRRQRRESARSSTIVDTASPGVLQTGTARTGAMSTGAVRTGATLIGIVFAGVTLAGGLLLATPATAQAPQGAGGGASASGGTSAAGGQGASGASSSLSSGGTTTSAGQGMSSSTGGPDQLYGLIPVDTPPTLTLEEVFTAVARSNPDLRMAEEQLVQQEQQIRKAWATLLPQISASGSYSYNMPEQTVDLFDPEQSAQQALLYRSQADMVDRSAAMIPDPDEQQAAREQAAALREVADRMESAESEPIVMTPAHQVGANLQVSVPLFSGRSIPLIQSAYDGVDLAEVSTKQAQAALIFATARAYYGAVSAQKLVEIAERSVESAAQHLASVRARVELGEMTPLVLQRAELDHVQAEQQLRVARSTLAQSRGSLGNLMDRDTEFAIAFPPPVPAIESQGSLEQLMSRAVAARPELALKQVSLRLAERQKLDAWMSFTPTVALFAQGNYSSNTGGFMSEPYTGAVGVQLSIPIFEGGSRFASLDEAGSKIREATLDLEQTERRIRRQVRGNTSEIAVKLEALASSRRSLELSRASQTNTVSLFELGEATSLDVIDARLVTFSAEVSYSQAELDLEQARLGLAYILGELAPVTG